MSISRRRFCQWLSASGALAGPASRRTASAAAAAEAGAHIGSLYPFVQQLADRSPLELSFLRPEFKNLRKWKSRARERVFQNLFYAPPGVAPEPQVIRRRERSDYIEEYLTFRTTPDSRVPAYLLLPKDSRGPAPGIVALHDHGGFYLWGKEKLIEGEEEHPALRKFKQQLYEGKSIAAELARQGYAVIVIDMFYWGERRMIMDDDTAAYRERPMSMSEEEIGAFNRR